MNTHNHNPKYLKREDLKQHIERDKGWYFITFVGNLPHDRPYGFTLYNQPFVLLRNNSGKLNCYLLSLENKDDLAHASIRAFPVKEKQGCIWFWHPINSKADPNNIPTINEPES